MERVGMYIRDWRFCVQETKQTKTYPKRQREALLLMPFIELRSLETEYQILCHNGRAVRDWREAEQKWWLMVLDQMRRGTRSTRAT